MIEILHPYLKILQKEGSIILKIKVTPKSRKTEIANVLGDGTIKMKLTSVPEKNKANEELIKFLANIFEVSTDQIALLQGQTSRLKIVKISFENSKES